MKNNRLLFEELEQNEEMISNSDFWLIAQTVAAGVVMVIAVT